MNIFLARQPILDQSNKVFGYELLFRDSDINAYNALDGDQATIEVIRNSLLNLGMGKIVGSKKAFINFSKNILKSDVYTLLSPETVIIEILEDIEPTEDVIEACKKLKEIGYIFALDDFVFDAKFLKLIEIADLIKVDFKKTLGCERKKIVDKLNSSKLKFVAEKVETIEDFNEAISYGYSYFQGYYFSKPTIMSTKKISENNKVYMHLIKELNEKEFSVDNIEIIIKMDISLSYKLLRLINSAKFGLRCNIKSIRHAILYLGEKEVKKWLYFIAIKAISRNKPEIIAEEALLRAKFAETVFISAGLNRYALNAYLTGMLSLIDTLLDRPLAEILDELFIDDMVKNALIGKELNEYSRLLNLILAYEDADWIKCTNITSEFKISNDDLIKAYMESVEWVNNVNLEQ